MILTCLFSQGILLLMIPGFQRLRTLRHSFIRQKKMEVLYLTLSGRAPSVDGTQFRGISLIKARKHLAEMAEKGDKLAELLAYIMGAIWK